MVNDAVKELFERCKAIDGEVRILAEDKKSLFNEYKDRVSPKVFNVGLKIARMKAKLTPSEINDVDMIAELLGESMTVEAVD